MRTAHGHAHGSRARDGGHGAGGRTSTRLITGERVRYALAGLAAVQSRLLSNRPPGKGHGVRKRQQASTGALEKHAADVALAGKFDELLAAGRQAELEFRQAEARSAALTERRRLAVALDSALTAVMRSAFAAQRAEIGALGYDDRIYRRKAMARPEVHALTAEAERLLTLRESHRLNGIPPAPLEPAV